MESILEDIYFIAGDKHTYQARNLFICIVFWTVANVLPSCLPFFEAMPKGNLYLTNDTTYEEKSILLNYTICQNDKAEFIITETSEYSIIYNFGFYCNESLVALLGISIFAGGSVGSMMLQFVANNIGKKSSMIFAYTFFAISIILVTYQKNYYFIFPLLFFIQLFIIAMSYSSICQLAETTNYRLRPFFISVVNSGFSISGLLFTLVFYLGGSWKTALYLSSSIMIVTSLLFLKFTTQTPRYYVAIGNYPLFYRSIRYIAKVNGRWEITKKILPVVKKHMDQYITPDSERSLEEGEESLLKVFNNFYEPLIGDYDLSNSHSFDESKNNKKQTENHRHYEKLDSNINNIHTRNYLGISSIPGNDNNLDSRKNTNKENLENTSSHANKDNISNINNNDKNNIEMKTNSNSKLSSIKNKNVNPMNINKANHLDYKILVNSAEPSLKVKNNNNTEQEIDKLNPKRQDTFKKHLHFNLENIFETKRNEEEDEELTKIQAKINESLISYDHQVHDKSKKLEVLNKDDIETLSKFNSFRKNPNQQKEVARLIYMYFDEEDIKCEQNEISDFKKLMTYPSQRAIFNILNFSWFVTTGIYYISTILLKYFPGSIYYNATKLYSVELVSYFFCMIMMNYYKFGRKDLLTLMYSISLIIIVFIVIINPSKSVLIHLLLILRFGISGAYNMNFILSTEIYPTELRLTGFGINCNMGCFSAVLFPMFLEISLGRRLFFIFIVLISSCMILVVFYLPETSSKLLTNVVPEDNLNKKTDKYFFRKKRSINNEKDFGNYFV